MLGGALACGFTHAGITPLDVTKCNMQVCRSLSYLLPSRSTSLFRHCLANLAPPRPLIPTMYSAAYPSPPLSHSGIALKRVSMMASHSRQSISLRPARPLHASDSAFVPSPPTYRKLRSSYAPSFTLCVRCVPAFRWHVDLSRTFARCCHQKRGGVRRERTIRRPLTARPAPCEIRFRSLGRHRR